MDDIEHLEAEVQRLREGIAQKNERLVARIEQWRKESKARKDAERELQGAVSVADDAIKLAEMITLALSPSRRRAWTEEIEGLRGRLTASGGR